ncbi:hypothetical protein LWI28_011850 [Acer negundo]|uniref:Uncharacterized protein n=1 Tax=Acer negundo TaxID=4023 RepID=A0AAD5IAF0_ACENE|nr:hypothetical protein LWI28_011850 [Acer negundo]
MAMGRTSVRVKAWHIKKMRLKHSTNTTKTTKGITKVETITTLIGGIINEVVIATNGSTKEEIISIGTIEIIKATKGTVETNEDIKTMANQVRTINHYKFTIWMKINGCTTTGRVMNLSLSGLLYKSTTILNFSLFQPLEQLQILDLSYNSFKGWVDSRAHHLKQLKILNLGYNNFNGGILSYLTTITSLTTLILNWNNLQDFDPTQSGGLGNLRNLEYLDLTSSSINVSLQELGLANLRNLEFLDLSSNMISGSLQQANLRNLKFLDLSFNKISGSLQHANLRNLEFLDLRYNGMIGSLQELGICNFKNLIELDLSENNFEGHLPPCVNNLTILRALDLSSNQLTGNIPSINLMQSVEYLSLQDNNFEGLFSFSSLVNLSKLEIFELSTKIVR